MRKPAECVASCLGCFAARLHLFLAVTCLVLQDLAQQGRAILSAILRPDNSLRFLKPGRLVTVRSYPGQSPWGIGVVVNLSRQFVPAAEPPDDVAADALTSYTVDTLLECQPGMVAGTKYPFLVIKDHR